MLYTSIFDKDQICASKIKLDKEFGMLKIRNNICALSAAVGEYSLECLKMRVRLNN